MERGRRSVAAAEEMVASVARRQQRRTAAAAKKVAARGVQSTAESGRRKRGSGNGDNDMQGEHWSRGRR